MKIIGIQDTNFKNRQGNVIKGVTLYTTENSDKVTGVKTGHIFLREELNFFPDDFELGEEIEPRYNRYGKVTGVDRIG